MNPESTRQNRARPPRSQGRAATETPWIAPSNAFCSAFEAVLR